MKIILFFPAVIALILVPAFMYLACLIAFPVLGMMFFTAPHAPFVFGWRAFKNIMDGDFKKAFE